MSKKAMKLALEALEFSKPAWAGGVFLDERKAKHTAAIDAIKQALEQPVQEPVATVKAKRHGGTFVHWTKLPVAGMTLYTTPPAAPVPSDNGLTNRYTEANPTTEKSSAVQPSLVQEPEIVQRVKRYAGQTMRTARNPSITARECIELANWLAANTTPPAQEFICSTGLCHYKPATQRPWVGLTDEQRSAIIRHHSFADDIIRVTTAKLKEKNT